MGEIVVTPLVLYKLNDLVDIMFDNRYFAIEENANDYVHNISNFIQTIPDLRHHPTKNEKYGAFYCEYKPNKRTSWFVTFDKKDTRYIVRNLINNHTKDYPTFIRGIK